jgi:hypothetical protein
MHSSSSSSRSGSRSCACTSPEHLGKQQQDDVIAVDGESLACGD